MNEISSLNRIAVLGGGSWGTALALHLARIGHAVRLWGRDEALVARMRTCRSNPRYLPGFEFLPNIEVTHSLPDAAGTAQTIVSAVPSHATREVMRSAAGLIRSDAIVVSATKGLEVDSLLRMSQVIAEEIGRDRPIAVLSGPSFALEVARQLPTAISVASTDARVAEQVQHNFRAKYFRLYATDDVAGVEIGGAMKNVIAIAAGVTESLGLGHNALAALITRGLAEIARLVHHAGGRRDSPAGLSGLGDLVLTCTGSLSRNRRVGVELGEGRCLDDILADLGMVAEGVRTTGAALALGSRYGIELPITEQMALVLNGIKNPRDAVVDLMLRPQRSERE